MRKLFLAVFMFVSAIGVIWTPVLSFAANQGDKPLMIIRFDSDAVNYEEKLDKVVKMALDKKPTVFFDIVAVSPDTKNKAINKQFADDAKYIAGNIAGQIKESGVPAGRIRTSYQQNKLVKNNEIQIFVQ